MFIVIIIVIVIIIIIIVIVVVVVVVAVLIIMLLFFFLLDRNLECKKGNIKVRCHQREWKKGRKEKEVLYLKT